MKATAKAYANIALVKYWGKGNELLRLPSNSSAAIGLDQIYTTTTVKFSSNYNEDVVRIDGDEFNAEETARVIEHVNRVRQIAKINTNAMIVTKNNFPKAVGAASSASGFAALTVAAAKAAGLELSEKEMSVLARQGSGSASRSIPGGISVWQKGVDSASSYAERIDCSSVWDMRVLLVFVGELKAKKVSTTKGMAFTQETSPYHTIGVKEAELNIQRLITAMRMKDWKAFGKVIEDECFRLHALCMTTTPNLLYWSGETVTIFQKMYELREQGVEAWFTVDAGPHVHLVCKADDADKIKQELNSISGIHSIVDCGVAGPAEVIKEHLF